MKVSSISGNSLEVGFISNPQDKSLLKTAQNYAASLLMIVDHIGSSIAVGEKGNLDAIHEFRTQHKGKK